MKRESRKNRRAIGLAVAAAVAIAMQSSAATIYVSGPSTNASPLRFNAIGAGEWHSLAVQSNGTVLAWGNNGQGQTVVPSGLSGVIAVAGGDYHSLTLKSDGTIVAWGDSYYLESTVPAGLSNVVGIAAGELHSLAVKSDGTVVGWGIGQPGSPVDANNYGQALVPGYVTGVVAVAAGYAHNLALKSNGTVIAWGTNYYGGATTPPAGLNNVVAIAAGSSHSLALKSDGTIVAWGDNGLGETDVPNGLSGVVAISANKYNSMALKSDGTVVTWGYSTSQNPVPGLNNAVAIANGAGHDLALRSDGSLAAWGDNHYGQTDIPGSSRTDHNIQDAVNAAHDGDTVLVAPGDYVVTNQIIVTKAIRLQSVGGPSETFLTGAGPLGQGKWCLAISNALAVADGFSFRPATPDPGAPGGAVLVGGRIQNCNFTNFFCSSPNLGGAILMSGGTVSNVIVEYIRGISYGEVAVYCSDSGLVTDSQILAKPGYSVNGGAIMLVNSRLQNSAITGVPGLTKVYGPAVTAISSTVVGCTISNNYSIGRGGAYLRDSLMDRCIVTGNIVGSTAPGTGGGGVFETNSIIRNSLIDSNQAIVGDGGSDYGGLGGGVYMQGGALLNCTITGNFAREGSLPGGGGGVYAESGGITNCIVYFNSLDVDRPSSNWFNVGPAIFDHCCTAPDPGGAGNITQDPRFVDPANNNYHLAATSPCVGAGVVQSWMSGAQDLDGNPRTTNGRVDMGAYQSGAIPILSITRSGSNIVLQWPSAGTADLVLQQSAGIASPESWAASGAVVIDDGTTKSATIPANNGVQFFRLRGP